MCKMYVQTWHLHFVIVSEYYNYEGDQSYYSMIYYCAK